MGNMVTVTLLTDNWNRFKRDPEGVLNLIEKMAFGREEYHGWNGIEVMPIRHADDIGLFYTHQNSTIELSPWNGRTMRLVRQGSRQRERLLNSIESARFLLDKLEEVISKVQREVAEGE